MQAAAHWTLVFYTAAWCDPGIPMRVIFEETVRDLARLRADNSIDGVVVDIDDEEINQQTGAVPALVSADALESVDFVPLIVLYEGGEPSVDVERLRLTGQLPKLVIRQRIVAAIDGNASQSNGSFEE